MRVTNRTVSKDFRDIINKIYPQMSKSQWIFTGYLMFGTWRNDYGRLLITREIVADCEGKSHQLKVSHNYSAWEFLEKYSSEIQPFEWTNWYGDREGKKKQVSRVVTRLIWPNRVHNAIEKERNGEWIASERVYMADGKPFSKKKQLTQLKEDRQLSLERLNTQGCTEAKELLLYLNGLPSNAFYRILSNLPEALEEAKKIEKKESREHQLNVLNAVLDSYQPFYKPTSGSVRIFAFNENMTQLNKNIRQVLTKGWLEFDLRSAQLAINSKLWQVRKVQKFLQEGGKIWDSLFEWFGLEKSEETKRIFKTALYSISYGASFKKSMNYDGRKTLREVLEPLFKDPKQFLTHPLIKSLWRARSKQLSKIKREGGAKDCFGRFLSVRDFNPRSILAQLSQSYELKLLYPVIELAKKDLRFDVVLWQHDGFSVLIRKQEDEEMIIFSIKYVVKAVADKLGINTELERSN